MTETPQESAEPITTEADIDPRAIRLHDSLLGYGYEDIESINDITVGSRIRHASHRWPEAFDKGTATALCIMERKGSRSSNFGRDIELVVLVDATTVTSEHISQWADYHSVVISSRL